MSKNIENLMRLKDAEIRTVVPKNYTIKTIGKEKEEGREIVEGVLLEVKHSNGKRELFEINTDIYYVGNGLDDAFPELKVKSSEDY